MKNWVVKFKSLTKGKKQFFSYMKYLTNDSHINHTKTGHFIVNPLDNDMNHYFKNFVHLNEEQRLKKLINGVGGRPDDKFAQSITLNLPFHLKPEEYREVGDKILKKFMIELHKMENIKLTKEEYKHLKENLLYYNVHKQPEGSKTQFNFLLPEVYQGNKLNLTKKKYSHLFKIVSNSIMRDYGHDIDEYEIIQPNRKKNDNITDYKEQKFDGLLEDLKYRYNDMRELTEEFYKEFKTIETYHKRLDKHLSNGMTDEAEKVRLRTEKLYTKVFKKIREDSKVLTDLEDKKDINPPKQIKEQPEPPTSDLSSTKKTTDNRMTDIFK